MANYGFMIYFDKMPFMEDLTDEERGQLFMAMLAYAQEGKETVFEDRMVKACYRRICAMIDFGEEYREKQIENGKKGGRPKQSDDNPVKPTETQKTLYITGGNGKWLSCRCGK